MTFPPVIRIFFAIDLPDAAKEKLGRFISSIKKKSRSNAIRWTKAENLHITLQFMPEVKAEHLTKLIEHVRSRMAGSSKSIKLSLGELHLFPNPYRPRVIVLEVAPQEQLANLSGLIGQGITDGDYQIESRPFRAHLTIGRIKQPQGINLSFLSEFKSAEVEDITMEEIVLFRSEPQPEGSQYTVLEKISLV